MKPKFAAKFECLLIAWVCYLILQNKYDTTNYCLSFSRCQEETTIDRCWYTCPDGWDLFQNSCYFFSARNNKPNRFTKALSACQEMDAYLVEIESKAEDDFIIEKATNF